MYDFIDNNNYYQNPMVPNPQFNSSQQQVVINNPNIVPQNNIPDVVISKSKDEFVPKFTIIEDDKNKIENKMVIHGDPDIPDQQKKRGRPRKELSTTNSSEIIRDDKDNALSGTVEDVPTMYTYMETTNLLRETLGQIDALSSELIKEFNNVRASRTMKNKYNTLVGISENVGSLIGNKISAIREINSAITKSNDLDYKKYKDIREAQGAMNDDKYIADLYRSFISNPQNMAPNPQYPSIDQSLVSGSGIIRADIKGDINSNGPVDASYLNYLSNLSPEQNLMRYENNPNVKQVVVYDVATGNKFFQVMDMSTGEVIPNVPVYDQMFMEDTTLDLSKGIAKNINLNEVFPIVQINQDNVKSQY